MALHLKSPGTMDTAMYLYESSTFDAVCVIVDPQILYLPVKRLIGLINPGWHTRVIAKKRITHAAWLAPDAGRFLLNSLKAAIKPQNNATPKANPHGAIM